jgi:GTPase Era involved in 16S rRNA processing
VDQIKEFIDDSKNKDEWQRKNTQRSQDLADQRKAIRAESEKWKTLKEDEDLMETIKDYVDSDHPLFKEDLTSDEPEEAVQADSTETQRLNELEQKVQTFEAEKQVESDVATLVNAHPELRDNTQAMDQVLKAAIDNNLMDLDVAYAVAMHESANDSALKKAIENVEKAKELRKIPEIEGANRADRTVSSKIPANYEEVRDMALNEYNLYE